MGSYEYATSYIEFGRQNSDIVKGWQLSATMQLRTPLRVLEMHGLFHPIENGDPPVMAMNEGIWICVPKTNAELGIDIPEIVLGGTMASDIGQIPVDGGKYLPFLKAVRCIVESDGSIESRVGALRAELARPEWKSFCVRLGGKKTIYSRFFPQFLATIPRLPSVAIQALLDAGFTTPAKLMATHSADLLAVKGIGPAKLKLIRQACEAAQDKDSALVDCVSR